MSIFFCFLGTHVLVMSITVWLLVLGFPITSLSAISGKTLQPDPLIAIFGVVRNGLKLSRLHKNAIAFASLHARRLILLNWKGKNPPAYVHWIREVMLGLALEKTRYTVHGMEDKYDRAWSQFISRACLLLDSWFLFIMYLFFILSFSLTAVLVF